MRKIVSSSLLIVLASVLLCLCWPGSRAYADGGAPQLAYVAGGGPGISIIDIAQKKVTGTFKLAGNPRSVFLSVDGRFLYVTQPALNQITVLAAKDGSPVCTAHIAGQPAFQAYDPQTGSLFVAGEQSATITNLDLTNCAVLHTFQAGAAVHGLTLINLGSSTQNNQLWVSNGNSVSIFDTKTRQQLGNIALPGQARYLTAPSGLWVYASTQEGGLYALGLSDPHQVLPLLSGGEFGAMDFDETTGQVYVPDLLHKQLDQINPPGATDTTAPREPVHTYSFNAAPQSVAITNDGQLGFVALASGQVVMLDIPARQVLQSINVGGDPGFIITGLYPPALGNTPQQASLIDTLATVGAYILVAALLIIPVWFVVRQNRRRRAAQATEAEETEV